MADPTEKSGESAAEDAPPEDRQSGNYTIDELAALTSVPSRTIRFYQAKGALPPPVRRGRVAYYDDSHAERLKLVAHLQDRGLSLRAIRDLFQRTEGGDVSVSEWLGVGEQLREPWSEDRPRVCTEAELAQLLSGATRPGLVADLIRIGLLRREAGSPTTYFIVSPAMLQMVLGLEAAGVEMETARVAYDILRKQLGKAADELVEYFVREVREAATPELMARSIGGLRKVGVDAVRLVFAQEVERALREAVEQGRVVPPVRKRRH